MPNGLYDRDALASADRQAALLRRLAAGEGVNEAVDCGVQMLSSLLALHEVLSFRSACSAHAQRKTSRKTRFSGGTS